MEKESPKYILPKDVVYKIISYMDIDTRRSLDIYTKLKPPVGISQKISNSFKEIQYTEFQTDKTYYITLKLNTETTSNAIIQYRYEIYHDIRHLGVYYYIRCHTDWDYIVNEETIDSYEPDIYTKRYDEAQIMFYYGYKNRLLIDYYDSYPSINDKDFNLKIEELNNLLLSN